MKKSELQEFLRLITKKVIKEYMASSSDLDQKDDVDNKDVTNDTDNLTSIEKNKIERDKKHQRLLDLKKKKLDLDAEKGQENFYKKKIEISKRYNIPQMTKDIQTLQGSKI